jgi:uncharacterized membrane protein SpoIIM required for sporulation
MSSLETGLTEPNVPRARLVLRSSEFRKGRQAAWRRLEDIIDRAERRGLSTLTAEDLQSLPLLYRTASSSLSVARATALDRNLVLYLENLALRAYFLVYGPRVGIIDCLRAFLSRGFPQAVRACGWHILLAFLAVIAGTVAGFLLVAGNEEWFTALSPESINGRRGPGSTTADLRDHEIFAPWPGFIESFLVFANSLFRHNATIGIMTFGLGIVGGVPTLVLLAYQGLVFGAYIALHYNRDLLVDFLGWVTIHGVTEFGAIILCGAGGLLVAEKMLFPGRYSRIENLAIHGKLAASLAGGAVLMLFVAGLIEGGFRQLISNTPGRFAFGLATAVLWSIYFMSGRREKPDGSRT